MGEIVLRSGARVLVDDGDVKWLSRWRWSEYRGRRGHRYATRHERGKTILMHREVLGLLPGLVTDHINGDGLDNRRENLRACTHRENLSNRRVALNNTSGTPGVGFDSSKRGSKQWRARIKVNGRRHHLGWFRLKEDAVKAYWAAAERHWGSFRCGAPPAPG